MKESQRKKAKKMVKEFKENLREEFEDEWFIEFFETADSRAHAEFNFQFPNVYHGSVDVYFQPFKSDNHAHLRSAKKTKPYKVDTGKQKRYRDYGEKRTISYGKWDSVVEKIKECLEWHEKKAKQKQKDEDFTKRYNEKYDELVEKEGDSLTPKYPHRDTPNDFKFGEHIDAFASVKRDGDKMFDELEFTVDIKLPDRLNKEQVEKLQSVIDKFVKEEMEVEQ